VIPGRPLPPVAFILVADEIVLPEVASPEGLTVRQRIFSNERPVLFFEAFKSCLALNIPFTCRSHALAGLTLASPREVERPRPIRLLAKRTNRLVGDFAAEPDISQFFGDVSVTMAPFPPMGLFNSIAKRAVRLKSRDFGDALATQTRSGLLAHNHILGLLRPPIILPLLFRARTRGNDVCVQPGHRRRRQWRPSQIHDRGFAIAPPGTRVALDLSLAVKKQHRAEKDQSCEIPCGSGEEGQGHNG
jgi:hypothetical protein